jgi:hypothetical protein
MSLLLARLRAQAEVCGAKIVVLRDLPAQDPEMDSFLSQHDFSKLPIPDSMTLEIDWADDREFLQRLSPKARYHQRHEVLAWEAAYDVEVLRAGGRVPSPEEFAHYRRLYRQVKARNLELNTFDLPETFFEQVHRCTSWELVTLRLRSEFGGDPAGSVVAVGACFIGSDQYVPTVLGLDYRYVYSHRSYRQCLLQAVRCARQHGLRRILFGMGAPLEKRRFGAKPEKSGLYLQAADEHHFDALVALAAEAAASGTE